MEERGAEEGHFAEAWVDLGQSLRGQGQNQLPTHPPPPEGLGAGWSQSIPGMTISLFIHLFIHL